MCVCVLQTCAQIDGFLSVSWRSLSADEPQPANPLAVSVLCGSVLPPLLNIHTFTLCSFDCAAVTQAAGGGRAEEEEEDPRPFGALTRAQAGWLRPVRRASSSSLMCAIHSKLSVFVGCHISVSPPPTPTPTPSPFMSARFTSFWLSVCLQSNSQMIIHLAAFDSSRQTRGLSSSTRGQINTFPLLFLLLSSLHFQSLLSYYTECYVYFNPHPC